MSEDDRRPCRAWLRRSGERPTLGSGFSNEENVLGVMFGSCTYRRRSKSCPVNKNWHCLAFFSYDLRACKALARLEIRCTLAHAPGVFAFQTLYDIIIYDGLHGIGERAPLRPKFRKHLKTSMSRLLRISKSDPPWYPRRLYYEVSLLPQSRVRIQT